MKNKSSNPLDKLRLKVGGVPEHFNLPWRLAIEEGLFREQNIMLHWSDMSGGTGQMIKGLETGSIDVAVVLTEGITKAILLASTAVAVPFLEVTKAIRLTKVTNTNPKLPVNNKQF